MLCNFVQLCLNGSLDFELKQYELFSYLKTVDDAFYSHIFSPYLLYTENLLANMETSFVSLKVFEKKISEKRLVFDESGIWLKEIKPDGLEIVEDIIEFSIPLLSNRITLGKNLILKYPGVLY